MRGAIVIDRTWRRIVAAGALFALALVVAAPVHLEDESQSEDHCAVCHLRHVSVLAPQTTLTEIAALVVASASFPELSGDVRAAYRHLHPSRGPPA
jgi:hypothetical protein